MQNSTVRAERVAGWLKDLRYDFECMDRHELVDLYSKLAPAMLDDLILHLDLLRQHIRQERAERQAIKDHAGKCQGCKWLAIPSELQQLKDAKFISKDALVACMGIICLGDPHPKINLKEISK